MFNDTCVFLYDFQIKIIYKILLIYVLMNKKNILRITEEKEEHYNLKNVYLYTFKSTAD